MRYRNSPRLHVTRCFSELNRLLGGAGKWYVVSMKLTAVFEPAKEGGYTCFVEEIPAAISQGETLEEAKQNLLEALRLVVDCYREDAESELSPNAVRHQIQLTEA